MSRFGPKMKVGGAGPLERDRRGEEHGRTAGDEARALVLHREAEPGRRQAGDVGEALLDPLQLGRAAE